MSVFSLSFLINLVIAFVLCAGLFYYVRQRIQILEYSQMEQAKMLQSIIGSLQRNQINLAKLMSSRNNDCNSESHNNSDDELCYNNSHKNDLIEVSEDDDSSSANDDDDEISDCDSISDTDSEHTDIENKHKIIDISNTLESHNIIEHIDGDDVKVIEIDPKTLIVNNDTNYSENDDDDENDDSESDNDDISSTDNDDELDEVNIEVHKLGDDNEDNNNEVIKDDNENLLNTPLDNSIGNIMNIEQYKNTPLKNVPVAALRQMLKNTKHQGLRYTDSSINKMSKKELIQILSS